MEPSAVKAWMSGDPVTLDPDASALEALELMVDRAIRHLPVVDAGRRLVGIVSLEDLRAALPGPIGLRTPLPPEARQSALEWRIADVMSHAPLTVLADAELGEAAERMAEARIGCLPVVSEEGELEAILTETDLLHALATLLWAESRRLPREVEPLEALAAELAAERDRLRAGLGQRRGSGFEALAGRRLAALERGLERAAQGRFGRCERCGASIPAARLRALPATTECIRCARGASREG
jgi:CBS domain-containing protein/RNA polymerase-binding transcription factor DksA